MMEDSILPESSDQLSEEELYQAIRERVAYLLETSPDLLMSHLYRLDVLEVDIKHILSPLSSEEPIDGLAKLILKRQIQRIETKKKYKSDPPIEGWEF